MDLGAPTAVLQAKLANQRPQLAALAQAGLPGAYDQAWKLLDPIFLDAERQGLGGICYTLIGKLLAELGLARKAR